MITIMKHQFPAFVKDFAGTYKANPDDICAISFDDYNRVCYMIHKNGSYIKCFAPVFCAIWYNMGNNAIVCIKKEAFVFDLKLQMMKIVKTTFIKKK